MDIGSRFSLEDFLAYFFPGVIGALGIYCLLLLTPFGPDLPALSEGITTGIIFFVISYIIGVICSGFSEMIYSGKRSSKDSILLHDDRKNLVLDAFQDMFGLLVTEAGKWNREHYYLCRSMVSARLPGAQANIQRQASLRQLRINLLVPLFIWWIVGITFGIHRWSGGSTFEGIAVVALSTVLFFAILLNTINRAQSNEAREVREVLTAFVSDYQMKIEKEREKAEREEAFE